MNILNKYLGDSDRASRKYFTKCFEPWGLGGNKFIFFSAIGRYPGISQAEICKVTMFDKAIVARAVSDIEKRGYIERKYDAENKKTQHLYLTEKGLEISKKVSAVVLDWNTQIAQEVGMDAEELEAIAKKISAASRKKANELGGYDCLLDEKFDWC